jgi:hypothetical protein
MPAKSAPEKVTTRHLQGKQGVTILKTRYDLYRGAILQALSTSQEPLAFVPLTEAVALALGDRAEGSVPWYTISVNHDLETEGVVVRQKVKGRDYFSLAR